MNGNIKRFIIVAFLMLLLLILAVFLMPAADGQAKEIPEPTFEERVEAMIREHSILQQRLIAYMEHQKESINLLAEVIYWENWHTDKEHLAAYYTGAVVMNRVRSGAWPDTVKGVLYQRGQYSTTKYFYTQELPAEVYDMARDIYKNGTPEVPENVIFQSMQPGLGRGHWKTINGEYFAYG